jgi:hypothetical protein
MEVEAENSGVLVDLNPENLEEPAPYVDSDVDVPAEAPVEEEFEETAQVGQKRSWPQMDTGRAKRCKKEVDAIRELFVDELDMTDPTMVSEYAEEIFKYMEELEVGSSCLLTVTFG